MRPTERLDIAVVTFFILSLALLLGCSDKAAFQATNLIPDALLGVDTLDVAVADWANNGRATSGLWESERMVTCDWHGHWTRSFVGLSRPDTTMVLQSAELYLYATRIEGNIGSSNFEVYTLLDSLMAGDIYWGDMPATDQLVATFTLPDPAPDDLGEDSVFVDITGVVADWISGESDRYGFMVKLAEEGTGIESIVEFGTSQGRNRPVEQDGGDTLLVDVRPSMRVAYRDTANEADTSLWYLPANDTFSDTLVTPFEGAMLLVGNGVPSRSHVKFDLDVLPEGSTLTRAVLELTVAADSSSFDEITVACYAALEEWTGFGTSIGAEGVASTVLSREDYQVDGVIKLEITPLVELQVAGIVANHGYVIRSVKEYFDVDYVRFYRNPQLRVYYALPADPWYPRD